MSQAYGLHALIGAGEQADRSFREIGVAGPVHRPGVVVPGWSGHRPGEIDRFGSPPIFGRPPTAAARATSPRGGSGAPSPRASSAGGSPPYDGYDGPRVTYGPSTSTCALTTSRERRGPAAEDRTDGFKQAVRGVLPGYTGHVPNAHKHFGSSHVRTTATRRRHAAARAAAHAPTLSAPTPAKRTAAKRIGAKRTT